MKKILLSLLVGCMGVIPNYASPAISADEKTTSTQEGNHVNIIPDLMVRAACVCFYDPEPSELCVQSSINQGKHAVVLENLTTGIHRAFRFRSTPGFLAIPFLGGPGIWRFSVVCTDCVIFRWDFTIDNGIVTRIYP